jgi:septal ring factor EnvC (AmiA/AmiB activator)|tara:strand:+ start:8568 stop:8843 length:276 start_codon:yes stop_codon:yes gene_type:complete
MAEKIKFNDEELKQLESLQNDYSQKQVELGQIHVQRLLLNQQLAELQNRQSEIEQQYIEIQGREKQMVDVLNEKYGAGQLDPETGVFTPTK